MKNRNERIPLMPLFAVVLLAGVMLTGCNQNSSEKTDKMKPDDAPGAMTSGDASATGSGTMNEGGGGVGNGEATMMDSKATPVEGGTAAPATPAQERNSTVEDMRGMRAVLVAELEQVRGRLNTAGATSEAKKTDQQRAAELSQGLERLDRMIKKIDDADDVSWPTVRESSMKEAGEFRAWLARYGLSTTS